MVEDVTDGRQMGYIVLEVDGGETVGRVVDA